MHVFLERHLSELHMTSFADKPTTPIQLGTTETHVFLDGRTLYHANFLSGHSKLVEIVHTSIFSHVASCAVLLISASNTLLLQYKSGHLQQRAWLMSILIAFEQGLHGNSGRLAYIVNEQYLHTSLCASTL